MYLPWLSVVLCVLLLLTLMVLCHTIVPLWLIGWLYVIYSFHWHSLKWFNVVPIVPICSPERFFVIFGVLLPLTGLFLHLHKCPFFCYLGWLCVLPVTPLSSMLWLCFGTGVPLPFTRVTSHLLRCPIVTNWCGPASSQVLHWLSLGSFHMVSGVPFPLTLVTSLHPRCFTPSQWAASASSQMSHCCFLKWLFLLGVPP